ncbi:hypothetical protein BV25DRAFT_1814987, partial [Artomyces pyxidatus]
HSLDTLADACMRTACRISRMPHMLGYDNINVCTSIFMEQRGPTTPLKAQAGTFGMVYPLQSGRGYPHLSQTLLAPIRARFRTCTGLVFNKDLQLSRPQLESVKRELSITVVRTLLKHVPAFGKAYTEHPLLQYKVIRPMPKGFKTSFYPLRTTTIEEATIQGNLAVHEDAYLHQLHMTEDELSTMVFQLAVGLFHLCLNLVWTLLHIHRGTVLDLGSLTHFFALMQKTQLGATHPDYHTLLAALSQILDGLLLEAWRQTSSCDDLSDYAETMPPPEQLIDLASCIIDNYASPMPDRDNSDSDPTHSNVRSV